MGRPPKFNHEDEFTTLADAYFEACSLADPPEVPTVNGLCLALDICRETLWDYASKPEFSHAVKRARTKLEAAWEARLAGNACTGAIFWLKNQGWSDKVEQQISGPNGGPVETITRFKLADLD